MAELTALSIIQHYFTHIHTRCIRVILISKGETDIMLLQIGITLF